MATTKKTKAGTRQQTEEKNTKKRVRATQRPVDPFATTSATEPSKKRADGDVHNAPTNDPELGDVAKAIAAYAKAKHEWKSAEARFKAVSGTVTAYAKRVLLGLMVKTGSKPKSQTLSGEADALVTTFYVDKPSKMDGKNTGRYAVLCGMFGHSVVDEHIAELIGWSIPDKKMEIPGLKRRMVEALQDVLSADELDGLFVPTHRARKGVIDKAADLCENDTVKMDMLLQLVVPTPTLKATVGVKEA